LKPLGTAEKHDLLEVIEDRHCIRSTLITSQLPVARWHEYLAEATLADALLDRLLHQSYKIELKGESLRKTSRP
jgi:DNA replication protein DnaC